MLGTQLLLRGRARWPLCLLLAACLAALPACEQSSPPPDRPAANNEVGGLSLTLSATAATFGPRHDDPAALTVTLWNANRRVARVGAIQVVQGHEHIEGCPDGGAPYVKNDLRYAEELTYLLRFADGVIAVVPHRYPGVRPTSLCSDGSNWKYGPVEVPAGGTKSYTERLTRVSDAFARCKSFCVTVVAEGAGLRSNAVFFNGEFALPKDFDPIAELRAYRQRQEAEWAAERARREEEERAAGFPPP